MKTLKQLIEQKIVEWKGKTIASHEQFEEELRLTLQEIAKETEEALRVEERSGAENCHCDGTGSDLHGYCNCEFSTEEGFNEAISAREEKVKEFFEV